MSANLQVVIDNTDWALMIAESNFCPKEYKGRPGDVRIAIEMGKGLGLPPMSAVQNISVINGRPSIWGDAMLSLITSRKDCEDIREWTEGNIEDDTAIAHCSIKRAGRSEHVSKFSIKDAMRAGLWKKVGPWTQYPLRMLQARARGFCCRDVYPDALKGIITREEASDIHWVKEDSATRVAALKSKLNIENILIEQMPSNEVKFLNDEKSVDIKMIEISINAAKNIDELKLLARDIAILTEEEKSLIRPLYANKQKELNSLLTKE
jgi:hypothetical protein